MRTDRLPTVRASVATRCQYWWGVPQANKFEKVSRNDLHGCHVWGRALYSEVPFPEGRGPARLGQKAEKSLQSIRIVTEWNVEASNLRIFQRRLDWPWRQHELKYNFREVVKCSPVANQWMETNESVMAEERVTSRNPMHTLK